MKSLGIRVKSLGIRFKSLGFWVKSLGHRVQSLGFIEIVEALSANNVLRGRPTCYLL